MDHAYASPVPFIPLPPEVTATGARIVSFLHSGGRAVILVGAPRSGKTTTLDAVLAGMPAWVERASNPGSQPLTLARILAQIGAPEDGDEGLALGRTLAERAGSTAPAVLAVDDAHTLSAEALSALARVPCLGGPDEPGTILLLSGEPALLRLVQAPGLASLRAAQTLTLRMPPPGSLARGAEVREHSIPPVQEPNRRWPAVLGVLALAALSVGLLCGEPAVPPTAITTTASAAVASESSADTASLSSRAEASTPLATAGGTSPARPTQQVSRLPAQPSVESQAAKPDQQVRRDFDLFLDRAGPDTAQLASAAREDLFREYPQWRARGRP